MLPIEIKEFKALFDTNEKKKLPSFLPRKKRANLHQRSISELNRYNTIATLPKNGEH